MEIADKIIGWIVSLSPILGGLYLYLTTVGKDRKKGKTKDAESSTTEVLEGTTVNFEQVTLDLLNGRITQLEAELEACQDVLRANGLPIP